MQYSLQLFNKFKISSAHFVVANDYGEAIHGHNFEISLEITASQLNENKMVIDFFDLEPLLSQTIDELDHRTLIPALHPELQIKEINNSVEIRYRDKFYSLPIEDVVFLPITNGTVEELARYLVKKVKEQLEKKDNEHLTSVAITVAEYGWQAAKCVLYFDS
ncbi:MAG: 6-pyruvoyl tetrahydropterin synthase family protein [Candidatus Odinarchaeota archaeon]